VSSGRGRPDAPVTLAEERLGDWRARSVDDRRALPRPRSLIHAGIGRAGRGRRASSLASAS
jgi:hypothetical protein